MNFIEAIHANMAYIIPYHVRKKHLELLILTLIRASENTASSDHVSHCKSGKTFGGCGEWGLISPHIPSYLRGREAMGGEGAPLQLPVPPQLPGAGDAAGEGFTRCRQ